MKYFFDPFELPNEYRKWLMKEQGRIRLLLGEGRAYAVSDLEDEYLDKWNHWKEQVDLFSTMRKPDARELLLQARFELTKYDEILKFCGRNNPQTMIKLRQEV